MVCQVSEGIKVGDYVVVVDNSLVEGWIELNAIGKVRIATDSHLWIDCLNNKQCKDLGYRMKRFKKIREKEIFLYQI